VDGLGVGRQSGAAEPTSLLGCAMAAPPTAACSGEVEQENGPRGAAMGDQRVPLSQRWGADCCHRLALGDSLTMTQE
jgi:hypothetical protein